MAVSFLHCPTSSTFSSIYKTKLNNPSLSYKPIRVTMFQNQSSCATIYNEVEAHIEQVLSQRRRQEVFETMHHIILEAPRSMAPSLCIGACEVVGGNKDQAMAAASSLHLMHAAAYTHENLLLSDQTRTRRMAHHAFRPDVELVTGESIMKFGYELLARLNDLNEDNSKRMLKVIIEISRAMGSKGMVEGQYKELECIGSDGDESCEVGWVHDVLEKKEGGLCACGAACGAILGGASKEEVETLRRYGLYVGIIHGMMLSGIGADDHKGFEVIEKLRYLALKELESLEVRNPENIISFVNGSFPILGA